VSNNVKRFIHPAVKTLSFGRKWILPTVIVSNVFFILSAHADEGDVLRPYIGYELSHNDNLLGVPDRSVAQSALGKDGLSDTARRTEAGFVLDKTISRQKLFADVNVSRVRFDRFNELDYSGKDLLARWNWRVGNHVEGNLGKGYIRTLTPFVYFNRPEPNLRTQQREFADASWQPHPSWRVYGGLSRHHLNYELVSQRAGDRDVDESELGLDYLARNDSSIGMQLRHSKGSFPFPEQVGSLSVRNDYRQDEVLGKIDWRITGKSQLRFLGGWVDRKHASFPARDFDGGNARLIANWAPSGKVGVMLSVWRQIDSVDELTAAYTLNHGAMILSTWDVAVKVRIEGMLSRERRAYTGFPASDVPSPFSNRSDTFRNAALNFTYTPFRHLKLQLAIYRNEQSSNLPDTGYRNRGVTLNTRYEF
jgi:exopolysaccharide biosynthesis operon protein EpsL